MDLAHGVIDVDERHAFGVLRTGQQARGARGQPSEKPGPHSVELLNMAMSERAQERAQRRGRPHPAEQPSHRAVAQHVEAIDAVRAGEHPTDHRSRLRGRVGRVDAQPILK